VRVLLVTKTLFIVLLVLLLLLLLLLLLAGCHIIGTIILQTFPESAVERRCYFISVRVLEISRLSAGYY
jgi:hypothetical protein